MVGQIAAGDHIDIFVGVNRAGLLAELSRSSSC